MKAGICILAGGLSQRMGMDKTRLRLGRRSLLGHIRAEAEKCGLRVRLVRRDLVPRCGPLGGVYTGLLTSRTKAEIFLACDMPFVSAGLLESLVYCWEQTGRAVFAEAQRRVQDSKAKAVGFPFLLPLPALSVVERQIQRNQFSLQKLAQALNAKLVSSIDPGSLELFNINTPSDLELARQWWKEKEEKARGQIHRGGD